MRVDEAVGRALVALGVEQAFGVVGSGNFHVTNALVHAGTRIEVANCSATLAEDTHLPDFQMCNRKAGETMYAYMAPCRIVEVIDEETWIAEIDYPKGTDSEANRVSVEHYNGIKLRLDILDIWAPVKLLSDARRNET